MNFLTREHFAHTVEYAIYTVDVPCALSSACLLFSVNFAFNHGVCRTIAYTIAVSIGRGVSEQQAAGGIVPRGMVPQAPNEATSINDFKEMNSK